MTHTITRTGNVPVSFNGEPIVAVNTRFDDSTRQEVEVFLLPFGGLAMRVESAALGCSVQDVLFFESGGHAIQYLKPDPFGRPVSPAVREELAKLVQVGALI